MKHYSLTWYFFLLTQFLLCCKVSIHFQCITKVAVTNTFVSIKELGSSNYFAEGIARMEGNIKYGTQGLPTVSGARISGYSCITVG